MKTKLKSIIQRIMAGALALVLTGTIALPKAEAVTGVDDVSVGIMAVLVHLDSIGGSLAVQQGTALATQNAVTALATQAGVAGALGTGVTGTAALATIGGAVTAAAAGGFTIGYVGYQQLSKLAEWIRQSKLTGTPENKIYQTGGSFDKCIDGQDTFYTYRKFYEVGTTEAGSSYVVTATPNPQDKTVMDVTFKTISIDNVVTSQSYEAAKWVNTSSGELSTTAFITPSPFIGAPGDAKTTIFAQGNHGNSSSWQTGERIPFSAPNGTWEGVFVSPGTQQIEKQEVTYMPPVIWSPPAPTLGQDVYYNPYPQMPQKPIKEIVEDVPKDIYDKKFDPAPPSILDPSVPPIDPPAPDIPPVNPNPDVNPPEEVQPYTVRLGDVFPFCIPFDIYHMVTLFAAEPEAPHAKWEFSLPFTGGTYEIEWDLREWDEVAALCRKLELILFCVGLAVVTSKLIKW